jgi:Asp-tRNA(Asn)/Glu-tRNA(Gln) amidotransferase A subunit family amidase
MENPTPKTEENLIEDYLEEISTIVKSKFNEKKVNAFTQKYIQRQLHGPKIDDEFDEDEMENHKKLSASEIHNLLINKEITYSEVVKKYHLLKSKGNNEHRDLTWSLYNKPLARAQEFDGEIFEMTSNEIKEKYPLLGFVMSIKDSIYMKDTPSTSGLFINLDRVATKDAEILEILKSKGAVLTSKGNIPQLLFSSECGNNIFGEGLNPHNKERSPGGSSGGEAALIALGYNNASLGTDVGGSVRIPAFFCGVTALKPTSKRVSIKAQGRFFDRRYGSDRNPAQVKSKYDKQFVIPTCLGPLGRTVDDIEAVMKVLVEDQSFDRTIVNIPWRSEMTFKKKIGVFKGTSLVDLGPTAKRAIDEAIQALLEANYEVIEFEMEDLFNEMIVNAIQAYNKNRLLRCIMYEETYIKEPIYPLYNLAKTLFSAPTFMVRFINAREKQKRKKMLIEGFLNSKEISQQDLMEITEGLYSTLVEKMKEQNISAILAPGFPVPAFKLKLSNKCNLAVCYTFAWNLIDVPVGVMKICNVKENEQFYESEHKDELTEVLKENAKDSKGMPIGVSIIGKTFEEEIVLKIMKDIEDNLGKIL